MHLLIEGLLRRGYRLEAALAAEGGLAERLRSSGVSVFVAPTDPYAAARGPGAAAVKLWRRLRWSQWLFGLVRRRRPRLLYLNTLRGATAAVAARLSRVPVIWHLRGLETGTGNSAFRALRLRCVCALAAKVVAVSEATAAPIAALGYDRRKITIAYNGIDVAGVELAARHWAARARELSGAEPGEIVIAYAGRLDPHKGILDFIHAARLYCERREDARFLMIGGPVGPENPDWAAIADALAHAPQVRPRLVITGFTNDVLALLAGCDIVTLPSHAEGFPRAVLEAMALGKPLVATAVGGIPEAVIDGQHGLLIPPNDPGAMARAWERLAQDAAYRNRLGQVAAERVRTQFTLEATTTAVAGALNTLLHT